LSTIKLKPVILAKAGIHAELLSPLKPIQNGSPLRDEFDGAAVLAIGTHPATVGSTAKKLLDLRAETHNRHLKILLIIDDRRDADTAKSEGLILDSLSNVMMMTQLQRRAQVYHHPH
jgi:hypothetical protein